MADSPYMTEPEQEKIIEIVCYILGRMIEIKKDEIPIMFRGMLSMLSLDDIPDKLKESLSVEDWNKIDEILYKE